MSASLEDKIHFKFAVNTAGTDKKWDYEVLNSQFKDQEGTIVDVKQHVEAGHALCAGLLGNKRRVKSNVIGSWWILLDIDNSDILRDETGLAVKGEDGKAIKIYKPELTLDEAIAHPFVQKHCALIYTTASHKPDWHKFRLVFLLPEFVEGAETVEACIELLQQQFPHDPNCKDAGRVFYGSTKAEFPHLQPNVTLPSDWVQKAQDAVENKQIKFKPSPKPQPAISLFQSEKYLTDDIDWALLYLAALQPYRADNYFDWLLVGMSLKSVDDSLLWAWDAWSQQSPSYKPGECEKKWKSFKSSGVTIGTLAYFAKQDGWSPQKTQPNYHKADSPGRRVPEDSSTKEEKGEKSHKKHREKSFTKKPDLILNQRYLGELPFPQSGLAFVKAPKGSGKTESLDKLVTEAIGIGRPIISLTHRILLGRHLCDRLGLTWISDKDPVLRRRFVGLCGDSLWKLNPDSYHNAIIIIDEIEQVIWHILNSSTCRQRRTEILKKLKHFINTVLSTGGLIIGLDADLSDRSIDYLLELIEGEIKPSPWICVNQYKPKENKTKVVFYDFTNASRLVRQIEECLANGENLYICADSRDGTFSTTGLTQKLKAQFPTLKILCVDANTTSTLGHPAVGFVDNIKEEITNWDVVICSPSIGSGVSIDVKGHFDKVFGIFIGVIPDWEARQALARVREPIERHVWCAKQGVGFVNKSIRSTNYKQIVSLLINNAKFNFIRAELTPPLQNVDDFLKGHFEPAHIKAWAKYAAEINASMWHYRQCMFEGLKEEGCVIEVKNDNELNRKLNEICGELQELNNRECSDEDYWRISELQKERQKIVDTLDREEGEDAIVRRELKTTSSERKETKYKNVSKVQLLTKEKYEELTSRILKTEAEKCQEQKYILDQMYASAVPITPELVKKTEEKKYHTRIQLDFFRTHNPEFSKLYDRKQVSHQIECGEQIYLPDLKNITLQVDTFKVLKIEQWIKPGVAVTKDSPELLSYLQWVLSFRKDIHKKLGINLDNHVPKKDDEALVVDPIKMLNRLLELVGFIYIGEKRKGKRVEKRLRTYTLDETLLNDERVQVFPKWAEKWEASLLEYQAEANPPIWDEKCITMIPCPGNSNNLTTEEPVDTIPDVDEKCITMIPCPGDSNNLTTEEPVDTESLDTTPPADNTFVPTTWKGLKMRVRAAVTGINALCRNAYASLSGVDCVVDSEPHPVAVEGGIQWLVWIKLANGSCKSVPHDWLECSG